MNEKYSLESERKTQLAVARKNLAKARKLEIEKLKKGYKWYKVDDKNTILVPFGKDGKPTEHGLKMIELVKNSLSIS